MGLEHDALTTPLGLVCGVIQTPLFFNMSSELSPFFVRSDPPRPSEGSEDPGTKTRTPLVKTILICSVLDFSFVFTTPSKFRFSDRSCSGSGLAWEDPTAIFADC